MTSSPGLHARQVVLNPFLADLPRRGNKTVWADADYSLYCCFYPECSIYLIATFLLTLQWVAGRFHRCPVCTGLLVAFKDLAVLFLLNKRCSGNGFIYALLRCPEPLSTLSRRSGFQLPLSRAQGNQETMGH